MNMFKNVLASVDLGDEHTSERVIHAALEVMDEGDALHVMCVVPDYGNSMVATFFPADHEVRDFIPTSFFWRQNATLHLWRVCQ